jgi:hypothetical protein
MFRLRLGMWPQAWLTLRADRAAFLTGDVPGLRQIPDYGGDDDATIRANTAAWHSAFNPVHAVFLGAAPVV